MMATDGPLNGLVRAIERAPPPQVRGLRPFAVRPKPRLFTVSQFCCHLGCIRGWFEQAK